jgi:signal recognition particle subunit SRP54
MGDVLTLVEDVQQKTDREKTERLARKLKKGKGFDFYDLREQLQQMISMGGLQSLLDKLPGAQALGAAAKQGMDDRMLRRQIALIDSMTPRERRFPDLIDASRKRRIASGAGMQVQDINRLLKQFVQMQKMMKKMAGGGLQRMMRGMGGRLPPGGLR